MSQWGSSDAASNSVIWAPTGVRQAPTRTNANLMYGNTTSNAYGDGQRVTLMAADSTELSVGAGVVAYTVVTSGGSGYTANATVSVSGGGGSSFAANAHANGSGKIDEIKISAAGSGYENNPTITVAAPSAITFNANTGLLQDATFYSNTSGVANTTEFITTTAAHGFSDGDKVLYFVSATNTAISGLTNATSYYVVSSNTTALKLSLTSGGSAINITSDANDETHTLRRQDFIEIASNVLQNNDPVTYSVATGNTALTDLTVGTKYYAKDANSTGVYLSTTPGGARISIARGVAEAGHQLTGDTATGVAVVGGAQNKGIAHTGWVVRTEGTGGRAGRVQYEVLVAGGIGTDEDADDTVLPDA